MAIDHPPTASVDEADTDLRTLREEVARLTRQVASLIGDKSDEAISEIGKRARRVRDDVGGAVAGASERGREIATELSDTVGAAFEHNVRERPLAALSLAAIFGLLVGALWRR